MPDPGLHIVPERTGPDDTPTEPSHGRVYGGRYAVTGELGRGGMGRVFRARDLRLGREVALKVLSAGPHDEQQRLRFEQEARAAGALDHPNILAVHDVGEDSGEPYIVSERLDGQPLRELLQAGPLPRERAFDLARQLVSGLAAAHRKGIVHRDLKPENLFVTRDGRLKILDFGIAKLQARPAVRTESGALLGTPAYMSPEQVRGEPADARSDVFACGMVLHELVTGQHAFERAGSVETAYAIVHDAPAALPPSPLAPVIQRCLQKDAAARYPDAAALLADLEALGAAPVGAGKRRRIVLVAAAVVLAALAAWLAWGRLRPGTVKRPSIAVLPFTDFSPQKDQEYFSDGIAEEILNALSRVEGLQVTGRTSSFSFKGKGEDLRAIGAKLGVDAVLEGSVRTSGTRARIVAQLVKVADGYQAWSASFDRELTDVFAVQAEIAGAVVAALRVRMETGDLAALQRPSTSPEAYRYYLLGRQQYVTSDTAGIPSFEKALELDPAYAPAWAGLASALVVTSTRVREIPEAERLSRALEAANRAVELAPQLPDAYEARAHVRWIRWDWSGARADAERALALDDGRSVGHRRYGSVLYTFGENEKAIDHFRRATEIDPLDAASWSTLGYAWLVAGRLDLAREACRRTLEIRPEAPVTRWNLGEIELVAGRPADALAIFERHPGEWARRLGRVLAHHDLGHEAESRAALAELTSNAGDRNPYAIAVAHAWRGERDEAFEWLERAFQQHQGALGEMGVDMRLRNLRGDPRFAALLRKMNLPAPTR